MNKSLSILFILSSFLLNSCSILTPWHLSNHEEFILNKQFREEESNSERLLGAIGFSKPNVKKEKLVNSSGAIYCYIMSDIYSVAKINNNSLLLNENSLISMSSENVQQYIADFSLTLKKGTGAKFNLRTTKDKYSKQKGLELTVSTTGIYFSENGKVTKNFAGHHLQEGETHRLIIKNHGKYVKVSLDCADFPEYEIKLPLTEFTIVSTENNSIVELSAVSFISVYNE